MAKWAGRRKRFLDKLKLIGVEFDPKTSKVQAARLYTNRRTYTTTKGEQKKYSYQCWWLRFDSITETTKQIIVGLYNGRSLLYVLMIPAIYVRGRSPTLISADSFHRSRFADFVVFAQKPTKKEEN